MTSKKPIAAAIRPPSSCARPREGDTVLTACVTNLSGSAPYFSTLARSVELRWVKLPVIWAFPPVIGPWSTLGEEITTPSSTIANWSRTDVGLPLLPYWLFIWVVSAPNSLVPALSKVRLTCHWVPTELPVLGRPAEASRMAVPSTLATSRRYLTVPSCEQETIWVFGLSSWFGS